MPATLPIPGPHPELLNLNTSRPGPGICIFIQHTHKTQVHLGMTTTRVKCSRSRNPPFQHGFWRCLGLGGTLFLKFFCWNVEVVDA